MVDVKSSKQTLEPALLRGLFFIGFRHRFSLIRAFDSIGKAVEKLIRHLLGKAFDQAAAQLGDLAANIGLDLIRQLRAFGHRFQNHLGPALGKARSAVALVP